MTHQTVRRTAVPGLPDDHRAAVTEPSTSCPVEITLTALRGRWTTLVGSAELLGGGRTYSELRERLPALSEKVLSDRLAHHTADGVLVRHRQSG